MRKSIRNNTSLVSLLKYITANGCRCIHSLFNIAGLKRLEHLLVVMRPHTCKKVGLQFKPYQEPVCVYFAYSCPLIIDITKYSELVLHMVANFMGNNVSNCKIAICSEPRFKFIKKSKVDIYLLITRTIKWPAGAACISACRLNLIPEQNQGWHLVSHIRLAENSCPDIFRSGKYYFNIFCHCFLFRCSSNRTC